MLPVLDYGNIGILLNYLSMILGITSGKPFALLFGGDWAVREGKRLDSLHMDFP